MTAVIEPKSTSPRPPADDDRELGQPFTDEELTAWALAADPDEPLPDDAEPWVNGVDGEGLLPSWYMPAPGGGRRGGWRAAVAILVIVSFLVINALGLCITYGHLVVA
jgi:hypothetical protein